MAPLCGPMGGPKRPQEPEMAQHLPDQHLPDHIFTLTTETVDIPLIVTTDALADFQEHGLGAMNEILDHMAARKGSAGGNRDQEVRKHLVADMMLSGLTNDNTRKLILCALWLAYHFPEITGLVSQYGTTRFVAGTAVNANAHRAAQA